MCKKRKLNSSLKNYTYPSPNKAIPSLNSNTSDKKISISRIQIAMRAIKSQTRIAMQSDIIRDKLRINIARHSEQR